MLWAFVLAFEGKTLLPPHRVRVDFEPSEDDTTSDSKHSIQMVSTRWHLILYIFDVNIDVMIDALS